MCQKKKDNNKNTQTEVNKIKKHMLNQLPTPLKKGEKKGG